MLRGTATAAFEDHQIAVIERGRAPASRPPSARAEGPRSSAAGSRQHCRSCRCDRLPPDPPLIASGSLSLGASPRSGTRCEFSELSHIESLWGFSLNSQLAVVEAVLVRPSSHLRMSPSRQWFAPASSVFSGGEPQTQLTVRPPSTTSSVPVMYFASSDARKRAVYATSQASFEAFWRHCL